MNIKDLNDDEMAEFLAHIEDFRNRSIANYGNVYKKALDVVEARVKSGVTPTKLFVSPYEMISLTGRVRDGMGFYVNSGSVVLHISRASVDGEGNVYYENMRCE